jgi:uncharacterized protein GlcG (DUF336 family)
MLGQGVLDGVNAQHVWWRLFCAWAAFVKPVVQTNLDADTGAEYGREVNDDKVNDDDHFIEKRSSFTFNSKGGTLMANTYARQMLSYETAAKMVAAAVAKAEELGCKQNVAVIDSGGNLKALASMDGALLLGIEGCQRKAFTALFGVGTKDLYGVIKDDLSLVVGLSHFSRATLVGGGLPIVVNGEVIGGIGVGGGTVDEDIACSQAGLDAIAD